MTTYRRFHPTERALGSSHRRAGKGSGSTAYAAILSTPRALQDGMAVLPSAWDLSSFTARGGPLLIEHNRLGLPQAGKVDHVRTMGDKLVGAVHLVPNSDYADAIRRLMDEDCRVGLSVGFSVTSERGPTSDELSRGIYTRGTRVVTRARLMELSLVALAMDDQAQLVSELPTPSTKPTPDLFALAQEAGYLEI